MRKALDHGTQESSMASYCEGSRALTGAHHNSDYDALVAR